MRTDKPSKKDLYYTKDHDWIDFQGTVAYIGICAFKLIGYREIQEIVFNEPSGFKKQGEKIATIRYKDYKIVANMPVDGKILQVNDPIKAGDYGVLLKEPETNGWIALIVPAQPYQRNGLLLPKAYQLNGKNKYAK
ncbi:MAG: hypothetical protein ABI741_01905 [Ferruginibacter sp.]